jgi:hypothetical protein
MISLASISSCKKYRYSLDRIRDENKDLCVWIMLNPSIADDNIDDPTIRRVINFSKQYWYWWCHIVNLFSLRSTDPKELKKSLDPIWEETTKYYIDSLKS